MCFSAEMACAWRIRGFWIPLEDGNLRIAALNHKPMVRAARDPAADFASEFLKSCHVVAPGSETCIKLRIILTVASSPITVFSIA